MIEMDEREDHAPLSEERREMLDERFAAHQRSPETSIPWEEVRARLWRSRNPRMVAASTGSTEYAETPVPLEGPAFLVSAILRPSPLRQRDPASAALASLIAAVALAKRWARSAISLSARGRSPWRTALLTPGKIMSA